MQSSRLYLALSSLNHSDLRSFTDFVQSPFFNKKERLVQFYLLLKKELKKEKPTRLEKTKLYKQVFQTNTFCNKTFNSLQTQLYQLLEKFLAYQQMQKDGAAEELYLLERIIDLKIHKSYQHSFAKAEKKISSIKKLSLPLLAQKNKLADLYNNQINIKRERLKNNPLEEAALSYDEYLLSKKLDYLCNMLNNEKFMAISHSKTFLLEIQQHLEKQQELSPILKTYYYLFMAQSHEKTKHQYFQQLKDAIILHKNDISQQNMRDIMQMAINFCSAQIRKDSNITYVKEAMDLYQIGVTSTILLNNNTISPWTYKNMVKLGINLQQYDWLETFIRDYYDKLPKSQQQDAYHFSLADLHYAKNDFSTAQEHLHIVEFKDPYYYLDAKVLLIKIYHEEDSFDALDALLFSFKTYLKRNKLLSIQAKKPYENFIRFVHQITKYGKRKKEILQENLTNTPTITEKRWLTKQIETL